MTAASQPTNTTNQSTIDVSTPYTPKRPTPVVSISINHPIATAARKIKNFLIHKQTLFSTTFNIKVTPIVALVSFLGIAAVFGGGITTAFNFGKTVEDKFFAAIPSPTPKIIIQQPSVIILSKAGTIKATYQYYDQNTQITQPVGMPDNQITGDPDVSPTPRPTDTPTPTPLPVLHYILLSSGSEITFLNASATIHLQNYVNRRVLITGGYDAAKNTLSIAKSTDIEILQ